MSREITHRRQDSPVMTLLNFRTKKMSIGTIQDRSVLNHVFSSWAVYWIPLGSRTFTQSASSILTVEKRCPSSLIFPNCSLKDRKMVPIKALPIIPDRNLQTQKYRNHQNEKEKPRISPRIFPHRTRKSLKTLVFKPLVRSVSPNQSFEPPIS